ncbi:MAG: DedA family protein [Anaerolineae bacterium]|jgi:membrane-associated protein|nr:DedA family protein [Anaerolineae bacterium]MBT7071568.1 DedA family protein [Anaerolineae bacterium]MBT7323879.1 DedA family protein [Anaerolineae bacterium]
MELLTQFVDIFIHLDVYLSDIISQYGTWTYAILFAVIFVETGLVVMPFLPGDSLLFAAGAIAAIGDSGLNIFLMVGLLMVAAILGDTVNYWIGHSLGEKAYDSKWVKKEYLDKTHEFFEKHGGKTIFLARFVPIIRTFAPFVAGVGKMSYKYFFSYNVFGGLVWVPLFAFAGYYFGNIDFVKHNFSIVILAIIVISLVPVFIEAWKASKESKESKAEATAE